MLNEQAVKIAVKVIKIFEGCNLSAYPDPVSDLYAALSRHGMLAKYMSGAIKFKDLESNFQALSGAPWTVGYGSTHGVTKDTAWTQEQADKALEVHVREYMTQAIKDCPALAKLSPERIAAITSLAYNIGSKAFKDSTVAKRIKANDLDNVPEAIKMWNKAGGKINTGLINRREAEVGLWNVKG